MVEFYFLPTMSFINDFFKDMTLIYTVSLIILNILLVFLGSRIRYCKEKFNLISKVNKKIIYLLIETSYNNKKFF